MKKHLHIIISFFISLATANLIAQQALMVPPSNWQTIALSNYSVKLPSTPTTIDSLNLGYLSSVTPDSLVALGSYKLTNAQFEFQPEFSDILGANGNESLIDIFILSLTKLFEDNEIISQISISNSGITGKEVVLRSFNPEIQSYELHFLEFFYNNEELLVLSVHGHEENVYLIESYKNEYFSSLIINN